MHEKEEAGAKAIQPPLPGEQIYIEFKNRNYFEEHGGWWIVVKRRHLVFHENQQLNTLMLHCEPDPMKGDPKA